VTAPPNEYDRERLDLAAELRRLRKAAGLSGTEVGDRAGISQSKVSKIETGRLTPSTEDVTRLASALALPKELEAELVERAATLATEMVSWRFFNRKGIRKKQEDFGRFERSARTIRLFQPLIIPGLLQTAEYIRQIMLRATWAAPAELEPALAARVERQTALYDPQKSFTFVILESAVRHRFGSEADQLAQVDRLMTVSTLQNVRLGLVPTATELPLVPYSSFCIFDDELVTGETQLREILERDPKMIAEYSREFAAFEAVASFDDEARDILASISASASPADPGTRLRHEEIKPERLPTVRSNLGGPTRDESLHVALGQIERQFGKGSLMRMSETSHVSVDAVSTGSLSLDLALGIGGLPRGRIVEVFGPESSGKTTLVYHVIAEAQRRGGICAFIDADHAMDPTYARRIGVYIDDLLVSLPVTVEQALEIAELLVRSGAVDVVAVDSVAALTPKAEIEGEMGDSHVGLQARLMSQAMRKLAGALNRTDTICLFTNQLREKMGVFGSPETTPGGRVLKFYASVRLDIRRIETLKDGPRTIGIRVRVKVVKNKVAPPFKQAEFDVIHGQGISWAGSVLDVALERKIVSRIGSYFSFADERLGKARQDATAFLQSHPGMVEAIVTRIQADAGPYRVSSARVLTRDDAMDIPAETVQTTSS
jgi:recombination protein RecA